MDFTPKRITIDCESGQAVVFGSMTVDGGYVVQVAFVRQSDGTWTDDKGNTYDGSAIDDAISALSTAAVSAAQSATAISVKQINPILTSPPVRIGPV